MTEPGPQEHRFKGLLVGGGLVVAVLGLLMVWRGYELVGMAVVAAGVIFWLVVKRRSRKAKDDTTPV